MRENRHRYTVEARPVGCLARNVLVLARTWPEACEIASRIKATAAPTVTVTDIRTGQRAAF